MAEMLIETESIGEVIGLFGSFDENVKIIEKELGVHILNRETTLKIEGDEEALETAQTVIKELLKLIGRGETLTEQNIRYTISMVTDGMAEHIGEIGGDTICISSSGKPVKAKTLGQKNYIKSIEKKHRCVRRRSCRNGQDIPCRRNGGKGFQKQRNKPYNPDASGRRSRRKVGISARRFADEDRPVSKASLRCAL